jgi:hypothetical protein
MTNVESHNESLTAYMPDGTPAPYVMTAADAVKFLRLDTNGTQHPEMTLQYYRQQGLLRATRVGKTIRYLKSELIQLLNRLTERTNDDVS